MGAHAQRIMAAAFAATAFLALASGRAQAVEITLQSLLEGGTLFVADKFFSGFELSLDTNEGASGGDFGKIKVEGAIVSPDDVRLRFRAGEEFDVTGSEIKFLGLRFTVDVQDELKRAVDTGIHLVEFSVGFSPISVQYDQVTFPGGRPHGDFDRGSDAARQLLGEDLGSLFGDASTPDMDVRFEQQSQITVDTFIRVWNGLFPEDTDFSSLNVFEIEISQQQFVPEPGTFALLVAAGAGGLWAWRLRRRANISGTSYCTRAHLRAAA